MNETPLKVPSFFARLWLATRCFFRLIIDGEFAREVVSLRQRGAVPSGPIVEAGSMLAGVLTATPVIPTPPAAPTPAEAAAEKAGAAVPISWPSITGSSKSPGNPLAKLHRHKIN